MNEFLENSLFAGVTISLLAYMAGAFLKKKIKIALLNPLLISIILSIVVLVTADIDYDVYNAGASYLSWFLTPATVCLAIPQKCIDLNSELVQNKGYVNILK